MIFCCSCFVFEFLQYYNSTLLLMFVGEIVKRIRMACSISEQAKNLYSGEEIIFLLVLCYYLFMKLQYITRNLIGNPTYFHFHHLFFVFNVNEHVLQFQPSI